MKKIFVILFITIVSIVISSCEGKIGVAEEYKIVFWYDATTANQFAYDEATTLTFYINGKPVATTPVSRDVFWKDAPSCSDKNAIAATVYLHSSEKYITCKVVDDRDFEYWAEGRIPNGSCTAIKIGPLTKFKIPRKD